MKMYETTQSVDKYLNIPLECDCGMTHYAPIKAVNVSAGATNNLPDLVKEFGYHKPYILCDKTTYEIVGKRCGELLTAAGIDSHVLVIKHMGYDEATLGEIVLNKPDDCDLMVGCGTGSITDMVRFASFKMGLPSFTICTAAPMDGFSASAGIMNVDNLKKTMPAQSTEVIIGDTDILSNAPFRMTLAGFSDLIAKLNALNDWRLDVIVNNVHYCKKMDVLIDDYVRDMLGKAPALKARDPKAIGDLMNALLLTGATITLYGNSRPISGAEHHMSHLWEALGEQSGKHFAMHGELAGVGTVLALMVVEELRTKVIDFDKAREKAKKYDTEAWKNEVTRVYGSAAAAIIQLEQESGKNNVDGMLARIDRIEKHWDEIKALFDGYYSSQELRNLLKDLGCPADPKEIGVGEELLKDTFMYCKETRARYTSYQLAWDLGLLDEISDVVIEKLKVLGAL